jgi:hypothetical protein
LIAESCGLLTFLIPVLICLKKSDQGLHPRKGCKYFIIVTVLVFLHGQRKRNRLKMVANLN